MIITGDQIRVGDTLTPACNDRQFFVAALRPKTGPLLDLLGEGSQIGECVFSSGVHPMTLPANSRYRVISRASSPPSATGAVTTE